MSIIQQSIQGLAPARSFPVKPLPEGSLAHGVVVRTPNWLGDVVMTLPALKMLRNLLPKDAPLVVITPANCAELFRMVSGIDGILPLKTVHTSFSPEVLAQLKRCQFKTGILFSNSLRDAIQLRKAGIRYLYGRAARCRSLLLKRSFSFPKWKRGVWNESHHANEYMAMIAALGGVYPESVMPELHISQGVGQLSFELQGLCQHPRLMILAPGAAYGAAKRWSSGNYQAVTKHFVEHGGLVVIVGSHEEQPIGEEIRQGLPENKVVNLCGKTGFRELYHLLSAARLCLCNDSGIMHLAAALGTPGVAVFGPTDYRATGPVSDLWRIVVNKTECAPCFRRECPHNNPRCMKGVAPEEVIEAVQETLQAGRKRK